MDVHELQRRLAAHDDLIVLDIRPRDAREEWRIPGSVWVDTYAQIWDDDYSVLDAAELPTDKPVVAVCMAGKTSQLAASRLEARGIKAHSLDGGMQAWNQAYNSAERDLGDGVTLVQVRRTGMGCLSYLLASAGEALVIDASVDPQAYVDHAKRLGATIGATMDTHVHADHVTRTRRLAQHLGVPYRMHEKAPLSFAFDAFAEGDQIPVGDHAVTVMATPGHTWESSSYQIDNAAVLTGDTLFIDGVGRPDLGAGTDEVVDRAHALYDSTNRLAALDPMTEVLPAHASQPLPFDGVQWSAPISAVRQRVRLLDMPQDAFVDTIMARVPDVPATYHRIVEVNRAGEWPDDELETLECGPNKCASG